MAAVANRKHGMLSNLLSLSSLAMPLFIMCLGHTFNKLYSKSYSRFLAPLRAMFWVGLEGVSVQGSFPHGSGLWSAQTSAKDMEQKSPEKWAITWANRWAKLFAKRIAVNSCKFCPCWWLARHFPGAVGKPWIRQQAFPLSGSTWNTCTKILRSGFGIFPFRQRIAS